MIRTSLENRLNAGRDLFKGMEKKKPKETKRRAAPAILVGEHGRYQIKSGRLSGEYVARAFPMPPTKARGLIAEATGATEEAAIAALHLKIDAREKRRTGKRRMDPQMGAAVPSAEEFVEAMIHVALSRPQRAMLTALSVAGEGGLTEERTANAAGYKSVTSANRALAAAGMLIGDYLSVDAGPGETRDGLHGTAILGYRGAVRGDGDPGNWVLHAELREAVRAAL